MKHLTILLAFISICSRAYSQVDKLGPLVFSENNINVYQVPESNEYADAKLNIKELMNIPNTNEMSVLFSVENYELKASSKNNLTGLCANSGDGQHIHFIVDGKPYSALYNEDYKWKEHNGNHTLLAFLSRSHHQSIKTKDAHVFTTFSTNKASRNQINIEKPMMIYSRPKGTYVDQDTKNIMLDFYMLNCDLSPNGYKILVILDNAIDFFITKWSPYIISGLTMGKHRIKMVLLDKNNKPVITLYNPVERDFILMNNP